MENRPFVMPDSPSSREAAVLLIGSDATILSYRQLVLHHAGLTVVSLHWDSGDMPLIPVADAVVLCHTLSACHCRQIIRTIRERTPAARMIGLSASRTEPADLDSCDSVIDNLSGPRKLIETVLRLLGHAADPAAL